MGVYLDTFVWGVSHYLKTGTVLLKHPVAVSSRTAATATILTNNNNRQQTNNHNGTHIFLKKILDCMLICRLVGDVFCACCSLATCSVLLHSFALRVTLGTPLY